MHLVVIGGYLVGRLFLSLPAYLAVMGFLGLLSKPEATVAACSLLGKEWSVEGASGNHGHNSGQSCGEGRTL